MNIAIVGLGYVGCTTAAALLTKGHVVIGIDTNESRVRDINQGIIPILEAGVTEAISLNKARFRASTSIASISAADIVLVCVGTPSLPDGAPDLSAVCRCISGIGQAIIEQTLTDCVVVVRSTVPPGTMHGFAEHFPGRLVFHPEFLREGTAMDDFFHPPKLVYGCMEPIHAAPLRRLYDSCGIRAREFTVHYEDAEMIKLADNAFHAMKMSFANEIGQLARAYGAKPTKVMEMLCADTELNISPAYLRPGFAFGGSCLPKDLRTVAALGRSMDVRIPLLNAVLPSNEARITDAVERVLAMAPKVVGILGVSFKPEAETDDVRESAVLKVAGRLSEAGVEIVIVEPNLSRMRHVKFPDGWYVFDNEVALNRCDVVVLNRHPSQVFSYRGPTLDLVNNDRVNCFA